MPSRRSKQSAAASSKAAATAVAVAPAAADTKPEVAHATVAPHQAPKPRLRRNGPVHVRDLHSPRVVHVLTTTMVCHLPAAFAADGRLYLCSAFNTPRGCRLGDSCPNVHAQIDAAAPPPTYVAHERDATWITLADVDAAQPGTSLFDARVGTLAVAAPNAKPGDDTKPVPAHKCLATAVLESARKPISHCAHFRAKGVCDLGAKCAFVHALEDLADAPSAGVKSPHMQMPAFAEPTADEDDNEDDDVCCQQRVTPTRDWTDSFAHTSMASPQKNASSSVLLPRARYNNNNRAAAASSYSHNPYSLAYSCAPSTAASSLTTSPPTSTSTMMTRTTGPRYRHDPYSLAGTPLWA